MTITKGLILRGALRKRALNGASLLEKKRSEWEAFIVEVTQKFGSFKKNVKNCLTEQ